MASHVLDRWALCALLWGATSSGSHVSKINAFVITMSDTKPTAAEDEKSTVIESVPVHTGAVEGLYIAEAAGEPMKELASADVIASRGIRGDRYMKRQGTFSVFRQSIKDPGRREPGRQLTLVAAEGIEEALLSNGIQAFESLGDFRRNVVVRGIPAAVLQSAVGHEIALGDEVVIMAHRPCVPFMYNERKNGRAGLMEATWDVGGLSCEVVKGGTLKAGDTVSILDAYPARMDEGHQAPGFFMRPSTRTRKQVVQAQQMQQAALPKLLEVDPNGVARALESFHSVGLQLFKRPKRFRRADALQERFCTMIAIFLALVVVLWLNQHGKDLVKSRLHPSILEFSGLPDVWASLQKRFATTLGGKDEV